MSTVDWPGGVVGILFRRVTCALMRSAGGTRCLLAGRFAQPPCVGGSLVLLLSVIGAGGLLPSSGGTLSTCSKLDHTHWGKSATLWAIWRPINPMVASRHAGGVCDVS